MVNIICDNCYRTIVDSTQRNEYSSFTVCDKSNKCIHSAHFCDKCMESEKKLSMIITNSAFKSAEG